MSRIPSSRWLRLVAGSALVIAGAVVFIARPGIALAHHVTITESASCDGWSTKADYAGGPGDRKIVVDVTINDEHIEQTLYFDLELGHLGHVDYYVLYERTGTGSLTTSGSVTMYEKVNGNYTVVADSDSTDIDLVCSTATPSPTEPITSTPTSTPTVEQQGATTPLATDTPTPQPTSTDTPQPSTTATVVTTDGTTTPIPTNTPVSTSTPESTNTPPAGTATPAAPTRTPIPPTNTPPASTPTLTSSVRGLVPPDRPSGGNTPQQPTGRAFPATGAGDHGSNGILGGIVGALTAAIGLVVIASGLRRRAA